MYVVMIMWFWPTVWYVQGRPHSLYESQVQSSYELPLHKWNQWVLNKLENDQPSRALLRSHPPYKLNENLVSNHKTTHMYMHTAHTCTCIQHTHVHAVETLYITYPLPVCHLGISICCTCPWCRLCHRTGNLSHDRCLGEHQSRQSSLYWCLQGG